MHSLKVSESRMMATAPSPASSMVARRLAAVVEHPQVITVPLFFVLFVVGWEATARIREVPAYILPTPTQIVAAFGTGYAVYWDQFQVTMTEIAAGFAIGAVSGLLLGAVLAQSRILEATFYPYLVALKAVPLQALAPLFIIWFGFGLASKIALTALIVFFPVMVNTMMGMKAAAPQKVAILRSVGASEWQVFRMVRLPNALPDIFTGLEISIIYAPIGAVVGEFVGAQKGLGKQVLQQQAQLEVAGVFAATAILAAIGIVLYLFMRFVRRRVVFWAA
jgi:NitT/TauT family transport system permease protein